MNSCVNPMFFSSAIQSRFIEASALSIGSSHFSKASYLASTKRGPCSFMELSLLIRYAGLDKIVNMYSLLPFPPHWATPSPTTHVRIYHLHRNSNQFLGLAWHTFMQTASFLQALISSASNEYRNSPALCYLLPYFLFLFT